MTPTLPPPAACTTCDGTGVIIVHEGALAVLTELCPDCQCPVCRRPTNLPGQDCGPCFDDEDALAKRREDRAE